MKRILLVLFSAFILVSGNAQIKADPPVTQENVRLGLAQGMANFVNSVEPYYVKGQDQKEFITQLCGTWNPTPEGYSLLGKAYEFITNGYTGEGIIESYQGKEMAASVLYLKKIYDVNPESDGCELFGGKTGVNDNGLTTEARAGGCRWYQLWCHLENVANWIVANWDTIERILRGFALIR